MIRTDRLPPILLAAAVMLPCSLSAQHISTYGSGSAGTGGATPALWCNSTPRPGNTSFALQIEKGLAAAPAVAFMSTARASLNLSGLELLVDLTVGFSLGATVLNASGNGSLAAPLPNLPVVNGLDLHFQTYVLDPAGPFLSLSATQGLTATPRSGGAFFAAPSTRIALPSLSISTFSNGAGAANAMAITSDASRLFLSGRLGTGRPIVALDASKNPPVTTKTWSLIDTATTAWTMTVSPGDKYLYVTNQGPSTTTPKVEAFYLDSARFGQPVAGPVLDPKTISAMRMLFNPPGTRGYLATLGIGGPAAFVEYNTIIGSTTQHAELRRINFSGKFVFEAQITADGSRAFVAVAPLGGDGEIAIIDPRTMRIVDWDLQTAGIQNIGGEKSRPRTPLGRVQTSLAIDGRKRYLYIANAGGASGSASLIRLCVERGHPDFGKTTNYTRDLPTREMLGNVLVSPAGDTVFLVLRSSRRIHVINSAASGMTQRKVFQLRAAVNELAYR